MTTILAFIFVLGVLVFVHELGHFLVAKAAKIRVETFSLGFPPKAIGITVGETEYCLSWLPIGGYVKVAGMADFGHEQAKGEPWEFQSKPKWIQMSVMAAGPIMNFILAFVIIMVVRLAAGEIAFMNSTLVGRVEGKAFATAGVLPLDRVLAIAGTPVQDWEDVATAVLLNRGSTVDLVVDRAGRTLSLDLAVDATVTTLGLDPFIPSKVGSVLPGDPAEGIGLQPGDMIVSIAGEPVEQWWDMSKLIEARPNQEIELGWVRDGVEMVARIVPRVEPTDDGPVGKIGVGLPLDRTPVPFGKAISRSGSELASYTTTLFAFIKRLVSGQESGRALAGPVAIAQMAGQSAAQGWVPLFGFMALLSVNLGVLNLLPIPMLDGGHLMVMSIEAVIRRPLSVRQKEALQQVGFAFLIFVMLYVTFGDLGRIFGWFN